MLKKKAFSKKKLRKQPCHSCGGPARFQWNMQVCANKRRTVYVPLCAKCDIARNGDAIRILYGDTRKARRLMKAYSRKVLGG